MGSYVEVEESLGLDQTNDTMFVCKTMLNLKSPTARISYIAENVIRRHCIHCLLAGMCGS